MNEFKMLARYIWTVLRQWSGVFSIVGAILAILYAYSLISESASLPSEYIAILLMVTLFFSSYPVFRQFNVSNFDSDSNEDIVVQRKDHNFSLRDWFDQHRLIVTEEKAKLIFTANFEVYNPGDNLVTIKFVNKSLESNWELKTKNAVKDVPVILTSPRQNDGIVNLTPKDIKPLAIRTDIPIEFPNPELGFSHVGALTKLILTIGIERAGKETILLPFECDVSQIHIETENTLTTRAQNDNNRAPEIIKLLKEYWHINQSSSL